MNIVIVDYGSGNLRSVQRGFERLGRSAEITGDPERVSNASHLVVPGVGAFADCMAHLKRLDLLAPIQAAIRAEKPYLGICLGLQILFSEGMEFGLHPGLGLIPGQVVPFPDSRLKIPHMGWNQIRIEQKTPFLQGIPDGAYFYFVHSYFGLPKDARWAASTTEYGIRFPSAVAQGHLFACQFHPEKSQALGLQILSNFAQLS